MGKKEKPHSVPERVYSTAPNDTCPVCWMPLSDCLCPPSDERTVPQRGKVVVRRETQGRQGKTITRIVGLPLEREALDTLAADLRRHCAVGGTVKGSDILIQGDRIDQVASYLEDRGFRVVRSGISQP